ncbi:hypothetical protein COU61_04270 [Candidatus Pacearchaeota archaeon CG10_big_fil_rev_8_21_14_0_10_35_13]|nr:MAG: hypothetical protein COU61_04270 [Candidatus Pacearchaeota archaeon CG10_big_fil_rev_8_21_14_0_10_35_13]
MKNPTDTFVSFKDGIMNSDDYLKVYQFIKGYYPEDTVDRMNSHEEEVKSQPVSVSKELLSSIQRFPHPFKITEENVVDNKASLKLLSDDGKSGSAKLILEPSGWKVTYERWDN